MDDLARFVIKEMQTHLDSDQLSIERDYVVFNYVYISEPMLRVTCKLLDSGHIYIDTYERVAHIDWPLQGCWEHRKIDYVMGILEPAKHDNIIAVLTDRLFWVQQEASKRGLTDKKIDFRKNRYVQRVNASGEVYSTFDVQDIEYKT
jgi:hypothetical protein